MMKTIALFFFLICISQVWAQPNIILIYLDDSPNGLTGSTGAPSFVNTPNINRIADSSMNFKSNYAAIPLCAPARAVLITGHYPPDTRVIDNSTQPNFNKSLPTIGEKLKAQGYYTAAIGKFDSVIDAKPAGWNYRLESTNVETAVTVKWKRNGGKPKKAGNDTIITKVIVDTAMKLIQTVNEPFFLLLSFRAPHTPIEVPAPFDHYYDNDVIQFGLDTVAYADLYPSFLYSLASHLYKSKSKMISVIKQQYRAMAYLDSQIGNLLNSLQATGKLDNTMIIYTSDNGYMNDQHNLTAKRWGFKQSVEVPLHIWYNEWFEPGESDLFTSSVDLYATILHAAGITDTLSQGHSIKRLYDGTATRETAYAVSYHTAEIDFDIMPTCKTVWDHNYKLIKYACDEQTEMFFDLQADPLEMINLINEAALQDTINSYRSKIGAFIQEYGDVTPAVVLDCKLIEN